VEGEEHPRDADEPQRWHPRTILALAKATVVDARDDRLVGLGAEVAFFFVLSLPPTLLAVFASVGFIAERLEVTERLRTQLFDIAGRFLSQDSARAVEPVIDTFLDQGRPGVAVFGTLLALWSASRATKVFMQAVNIAYDLEETRSGLRRRLSAIGITLVGILGAVAVLPLLVAGPRLGAWFGRPLGLSDAFAAAWRVLYWPSVALLGIAMLATFYHLAASWHTPWRRDLPGAILSALLWLAGAAGLRIYVTLSIQGNSTYGALGTPIAILLWFYVTALALLLGAELNAEIEKLWPTGAFARAREHSERLREQRDLTRSRQARETVRRVASRYRSLRRRPTVTGTDVAHESSDESKEG